MMKNPLPKIKLTKRTTQMDKLGNLILIICMALSLVVLGSSWDQQILKWAVAVALDLIGLSARCLPDLLEDDGGPSDG